MAAVVWGVKFVSRRLFLDQRLRWSVPLALLALAAVGTHLRNNVWHNEESLWRDSISKNPKNSRAVAGYGRTLVLRGDYIEGLPYLERAQASGEYPELELDIAMTNAHLGRDDAAARHFERAEAMAPNNPRPYYFYG